MMYDALDVASYIVQHCHETGTVVSNLKLAYKPHTNKEITTSSIRNFFNN